MTKNFLLTILLCIGAATLPALASPFNNEGQMQLNCKLGLWARNATMTIVNPENGSSIYGPQKITSDSISISKKIQQPGIYILSFGNVNRTSTPVYINMFLSNETIDVTLPISEGLPVVTRGTVAKSFVSLVKSFGQHFDRMSQLNQELQNAGGMRYSADSLNALRASEVKIIEAKIPYFVRDNKNSMVSAFLLNLIWGLQFPLNKTEEWVKTLEPEALDNIYGKSVREMLAADKLTGLGQAAPDFTQNDPEGTPVSLSSFKGKYVLIDFWASWCGPCRMENPAVVAAYNKYKSQNFTVLGVSLDREKQKWLEAIQKDGLAWTQVSDLGFWNNEVAKLYRVTSIPQNFLLDPEGKIIGKNLRGEQLHQTLSQVLKPR